MGGVDSLRKAVDDIRSRFKANIDVPLDLDYWNGVTTGVTLREFIDVLDEVDHLRAQLEAAESERDELKAKQLTPEQVKLVTDFGRKTIDDITRAGYTISIK